MKVTLKDIALDAKVGMSTVSYVLAGTSNVKLSQKTREKVLASAEKLGYVPNIGARGLSCGKTFMIGVLIDEQEFSSSFYPEILQGLENMLNAHDYGILLASYSNIDELPEKCSYLLQRRVEGVAVFAGDWISSTEPFLNLLKNQLPAVMMTVSLAGVISVGTDPVAVGKLAADYLVNLGHREIAYAGPESSLRLTGIRSVLGQTPCQVFGKLQRYDFDIGVELFNWLCSLEKRPSAVIVESDIAAVALIRTAVQYGWKLPQELSIVGIDGLDLGRVSLPALTSVGQPTYLRGQKAGEILLKLINGEPVETPNFEPWMIVRESCCKYRK